MPDSSFSSTCNRKGKLFTRIDYINWNTEKNGEEYENRPEVKEAIAELAQRSIEIDCKNIRSSKNIQHLKIRRPLHTSRALLWGPEK